MLTNFKQLVKKYWSDIILAIFITLIALISFGIGRLLVLQNDQSSIIIQNPACSNTASIQQSLKRETKIEQGTFVGSAKSSKYHWPECSFAKKISKENQIWFFSEAEAQTAGYVRCGNFEKYIP